MRLWTCLLGLSSALACNTTLICATLDTHMDTIHQMALGKPDLESSLKHLETTCTQALNRRPTQETCKGRDLCEHIILQLWYLQSRPDLPEEGRRAVQVMQTDCFGFVQNINVEGFMVVLFITAIFTLLGLILS